MTVQSTINSLPAKPVYKRFIRRSMDGYWATVGFGDAPEVFGVLLFQERLNGWYLLVREDGEIRWYHVDTPQQIINISREVI